MITMYNKLFKKYGFKDYDTRKKVFNSFISIIEDFINKNQYDDSICLYMKFLKYYETNKSSISIDDFEFSLSYYYNDIIFYHKNFPKYYYEFQYLKQIFIYESNEFKEEWVFSEGYLSYLIYKIYHMENPKFSHSIYTMNDEEGIFSWNEENLKSFMKNDWNIIYETKVSLDFDKIYKLREKEVSEKIKDNFFLDLMGLNKIKNLSSKLPKTIFYKLGKLFKQIKQNSEKIYIFYNYDIYFRFKIIGKFDHNYLWGNLGYLYINFELFRNCSRKERQEKIIYFLLTLFPPDYKDFKSFYESCIKDSLSNNLECWSNIINNIIDYFTKNIFNNKKEDSSDFKNPSFPNNGSQSKGDMKASENIEDNSYLFYNFGKKNFLIIFDNVLTEEENIFLEKIIYKNSSSNFQFILIYPLINIFTFNKLIKLIDTPNDPYDPFSLFFANQEKSINKNPEYKEENTSDIFDVKLISEEELVFDLIRIFNFKSIFVESINYKTNFNSIIFLKKYIKYINIIFDNENKKIKDISFKNEDIEKQFKEKYNDILNIIKSKSNIFSYAILEQIDSLDIEKIIISKIIIQKKDIFQILDLKSIFGLKEIKKKKNIDYRYYNFFLKQASLGAEAFDFGFTINHGLKKYLKIIQIACDKNFDDLEKISLERMLITCSYIKKKFEENELGALEGISFTIIAPDRILKNQKMYEQIKEFCKVNNYEFILFNLNDSSFYTKDNFIKKPYNEELFEIKKEYLLNVIEFEKIIKINKDLQILSLRKDKERNEEEEDLNAKVILEEYINDNINIKRVGKFKYEGDFSDLYSINENYFGYIYFQKEKWIYFYKNEIIKEFKNNENKDKEDQTNRKFSLIFILYSVEIIKGKMNNESIDKNKEKSKELELNEEDEEIITNSTKKKGEKKDNKKETKKEIIFLSQKTFFK